MTQVLKNKKVLIAAGLALLAVVAVLFAMQVLGGSGGLDKQLSLGDRYLAALDYDNAILAFTKALSIDPMNVRAYIGLADAYIGKGDTEKARETLQTGYDKTGDSTIKEKLDGLQSPDGQPGDGTAAQPVHGAQPGGGAQTSTMPVTAIVEAVPPQYSETGEFSEGMAWVATEKPGTEELVYSYIDKNGNTVITLPPEVVEPHSFTKGRAQLYRKNADGVSEFNFIDKTGKLLLEDWLFDDRGFGGGADQFDRVLSFHGSATEQAFEPDDGSSGCWVAQKGTYENPQYAMFDEDLNVRIPFGTYDGMWMNTDGKTATVQRLVGKDENNFPQYKSGIVDLNGKEVLPIEYSVLDNVYGHGFALKKDGQPSLQLMLTDGTMVEPQGVNVTRMASTDDPGKIKIEVAAAAGKPGTWGIMDPTGKVIVPAKYSSISEVKAGYIIRLEDKYMLLLPDGTTVEPQGYRATLINTLMKEDIFAFQTEDNKWGVMDTTGKIVLQPEYSGFYDLPGYELSGGGNTEKKVEGVVPTGLERLQVFSNYQIVATGKVFDENYELIPGVRVGLADLEGNILLPPTYEAISPIVEGLYVACTAIIELDDIRQLASGSCILFSEDGTIQSGTYNNITDIYENMVRVTKDGKKGFLEIKR